MTTGGWNELPLGLNLMDMVRNSLWERLLLQIKMSQLRCFLASYQDVFWMSPRDGVSNLTMRCHLLLPCTFNEQSRLWWQLKRKGQLALVFHRQQPTTLQSSTFQGSSIHVETMRAPHLHTNMLNIIITSIHPSIFYTRLIRRSGRGGLEPIPAVMGRKAGYTLDGYYHNFYMLYDTF